MTINEYQEKARRTQDRKLPLWALREHALYLLGAEVGEIMALHQKVHQGHVLNVTDLQLEIGDVLWGLAELCDVYGISLDICAMANIDKLWKRYPNGFEARRSVERPEYRQRDPGRSKYYARVKEEEKNRKRGAKL